MVVFPTDLNLSASAQLKSKNTTFPPIPRRGRVKAQIFQSLAKTFISATTKAGRASKNVNGDIGGDSGSSSPVTPPPSPRSTDSDMK